MSKVMESFICRGCLNPVTSASRTSVDIGASAKLELVDKFCYLGDMLSVDGDADAAVQAGIQIARNKLRHLVPLLTNKDISLSLIMRGRLYSSCVRSSMLHGSEKTWWHFSAKMDVGPFFHPNQPINLCTQPNPRCQHKDQPNPPITHSREMQTPAL